MAAIKDVLKHVRIERARAKRQCQRNKREHLIKKGDLCLVVQNGQESPNYCLTCAQDILSVARRKLDSLNVELSG